MEHAPQDAEPPQSFGVQSQADTRHPQPTEDPEALIEQATWALIDYDTDVVDRGVGDEHYRERRADVERVFPILYHHPQPTERIWASIRSNAYQENGQWLIDPEDGQRLLDSILSDLAQPTEGEPSDVHREIPAVEGPTYCTGCDWESRRNGITSHEQFLTHLAALRAARVVADQEGERA